MQLIQALHGQWIRVLSFEGESQVENKLRQYGLLPGDRARVMRKISYGGPLLIEVDGRSIVLGRSVACRIEVEAIEPAS